RAEHAIPLEAQRRDVVHPRRQQVGLDRVRAPTAGATDDRRADLGRDVVDLFLDTGLFFLLLAALREAVAAHPAQESARALASARVQNLGADDGQRDGDEDETNDWKDDHVVTP